MLKHKKTSLKEDARGFATMFLVILIAALLVTAGLVVYGFVSDSQSATEAVEIENP